MNRLVVLPPTRYRAPIPQPESVIIEEEIEEDPVIDMDYIIREKPDVKVVRDYFREKVKGIEDD